ncbi:uncharacterized protein BHQ10_006602 [Talaromyces amestolkiae]|uniref:GPI anchored cell wall protein n=1 Tax=Talaromyces amestolkiae TaxID=1196081 RepID=A0A364L452_TALAM|nr:uncharacterized protein BHQ10_006602 [Talaromyces amestolkiae]RAO70590.1 hypothetical protein BHQ10_006602 [Talaromyces amestolkiae]
MRTSTFAASALGMATLAAAQNGLISNSASSRVTTPSPTTFASGTTTIKIFEAAETSVDAAGLAGSIININAIATTILVECIDTDICDSQASMTMVAGPSTWGYAYTTVEELYGIPVHITAQLACNVVSSTQAATCTATEIVSASADGQKTDTTSTSTTTYASAQIFYDDLLITAGVEKLTSPQATETPKGAAAPVPTGNLGLSVGGMAAAAVVAAAGLL